MVDVVAAGHALPVLHCQEASIQTDPSCYTGLRDTDALIMTVKDISGGTLIDHRGITNQLEFGVELSLRPRAKTAEGDSFYPDSEIPICNSSLYYVNTGESGSLHDVYEIPGYEINSALLRLHPLTSDLVWELRLSEKAVHGEGLLWLSIVTPVLASIITRNPLCLSGAGPGYGAFIRDSSGTPEDPLFKDKSIDVSSHWGSIPDSVGFTLRERDRGTSAKVRLHIERNRYPGQRDWRDNLPEGRRPDSNCNHWSF